MNRQRKVAIGGVVTACVVIAAVTIAVVSNTSNPTVVPPASPTSITASSTTPSPRLDAVHVPKGSVVIFNIKSLTGSQQISGTPPTAISQPTAILPANESATLYYTCLGSARLAITFNGKSPIVTTPCSNQVQFVGVSMASTTRTIVPQAPTTVSWQVVAVKGTTS